MASTAKVPKGSPGAEAFSWLKIDDVRRDPSINPRPLDEARARRIADEFDPDAFGVISVSQRPDNSFVILDGQHRVESLRNLGWNGQKIPCAVFKGLNKQEEAALFVKLNSYVTVRVIDKFLSRIAAHEPVACEIAGIVKQCGFIIDRVTKRDGIINAAKALEDIYLGTGTKIKGKNPQALLGTIKAVSEAWGKIYNAVDGKVLAGVGMFLLRHGQAVNIDRLVTKLKAISGGPGTLVNRGAGKRELHGGTLSSGIGDYLTDEYNSGLAPNAKARLPKWRE